MGELLAAQPIDWPKTILKLSVHAAILFAVFFAGMYFYYSITRPVVGSYAMNTTNCTNLSLEATAGCLIGEFNEFFVYNFSQAGKEITLDEIKESGGVCYHAAKYYEQRGKELGFESSYVGIGMNETMSHAFATISDSTGYCTIDIWRFDCVSFGNLF